MPLYSNYNMLAVSAAENKAQIGDTFVCPQDQWYKFQKFHGLKIINIDYCWDKRLWFDWNEWQNNNPACSARPAQ